MILANHKNVILVTEIEGLAYLLSGADILTDYTQEDFLRKGTVFPTVEDALRFGDSLNEKEWYEFGVQMYSVRGEE